MVTEPLYVCAVDGVAVAASRSGALVHTDALPKGVDPDHEIVAVPAEAHRAASEGRTQLRAAAEDMLAHHQALHPNSDCEWARVLERALRPA